MLIDNIYGTDASVAVINGGTFTGVGIYNPTDVTVNGGTFEKGAWNSGFRWDFEGLVNASGCAVVDTGRTTQVQVQWSKRVDTHNLAILEVVAQ